MNIVTEIGSKPEGFKNNKQTNKFQAKMRNNFVEIIEMIVVESTNMIQRGSE